MNIEQGNTLKGIIIKLGSALRRDRRIIGAAAAAGLAFTLICGAFSAAEYSDRMQGGIAEDIIRLHVVANSDGEDDQALKLLVRDGVIELLAEELGSVSGATEAEEILSRRLEDIASLGSAIVRDAGYDYGVTVSISDEDFPTKAYGGASLPAGTYRALRVVIGSGVGQNWWCVMFPPLCFVDLTTKVEEAEPDAFTDALESVLSAEEFDLVTLSGEDGELPVKVKFKTVEIWQSLKSRLGLGRS